MEHDLQLTPRGLAICELMLDQGLTLDAACARLEDELATLRQTIERIMQERHWQDIPRAMQVALKGVSTYVQSAYLEEQRRAPSADGAALTA